MRALQSILSKFPSLHELEIEFWRDRERYFVQPLLNAIFLSVTNTRVLNNLIYLRLEYTNIAPNRGRPCFHNLDLFKLKHLDLDDCGYLVLFVASLYRCFVLLID
jgi:hypothetical protein